jgi:2-iminobutanoate/2-iminopropanoate deaminase
MKRIHTPEAPAAIGPYSQAIVANGMVYCSGQIALIANSGELLNGDVVAQTHLALKNMKAVLLAAGSDLDQVIKATVFLTNMEDFPAVNAVYAEHFGSHKPARACVAVVGLPKGVNVEIDCIAQLSP